MSAFLIRHRTALTGIALALTFCLLGTAAVFAGAAVAGPATAIAPSPSATPTTEAPETRDVPTTVAAPARVRTCSIAAQAQDPLLGTFKAYVINAATGQPLFNRSGGEFVAAASVMKVLTASAALAVLGPDYRIPTRVYRGSEPGSVYLVGYGDATITRLTSGSSYYPGAARLSDLAGAAKQAFDAKDTAGLGITTIYLDSSYWNPADNWIDGEWERTEQTQGYMSEVTALQVDGDRDDPRAGTSRRSDDPITRAGTWFRDLLPDSGGATLVTGTTPAGAELLAEVYSPPISQLIQNALRDSDNTTMEMLARITSKASGYDATFASLGTSTPAALSAYGVDTTGLVIRDGSGLSDANGLSAAYVANLMVHVQKREANLGIVYDGLPIAGQTGTLSSRFTGANAEAAGKVRAKTGWINTAYTLAGIIDSADGTPLTFAYFATGAVTSSARQSLDTITTATYRCGDNLSDY